MKKFILFLALLVTVTVYGNAQNPAKQDSTLRFDSISFSEQYEIQKAEYMNELKKDSFYVSVPVISNDFYIGTVEVSPGIKKRHYSKIVLGVQGEWQYPPFDNTLFEEWLKKKDKKE